MGTSFDEMMVNYEKNFGVKVGDLQRKRIQEALVRKDIDYGAINRLTGLSTGDGDYECPISAWGKFDMTYDEAKAELRRRVEQAVK